VRGTTLEQMVNELGRLLNLAEQLRCAPLGTFGSEAETEEQRAAGLAAVVAAIREQLDSTDLKVDAFGSYLMKLARRENECLEAAMQLRMRAEKWKNNRQWLEQVVAQEMQAQAFTKLEGSRVTLTLLKGRDSVCIDDPLKVPDEYVTATLSVSGTRALVERARCAVYGGDGTLPHLLKIEVTEAVDKRALKRPLDEGEVPGASISVGKPSLKTYISTRKPLTPETGE